MKISKINKKSQSGQALFMVTIMIAVLMGVSLSVSSMVVGSIKTSSGWADSVKAFHCADTGVEEALYQIRKQGLCDNITGGSVYNSPTYIYNVTITADCQETGSTVTSTGTFSSAARKIVITY
ncbi:MAG: hypothetical protein PHG23_03060 [Candidatus Pacebacteria bacterium]|nr:hypothetical protein [Candidatus Paceibacterota bacterium]